VRILVLASRLPYPLDKGDKLRLFYQLQFLANYADIHLTCLADQSFDKRDIERLNVFCSSITVLRHRLFHKLIGLFKGFFLGLPLTVSYFYRPRLKRIIKKQVANEDFDVVYCQLIRMAPYTVNLEQNIVIDFMDAFSLGFQLRAQNSTNPLFKFIFHREAAALKKYESILSSVFDHSIVISERDSLAMDCTLNDDHIVVSNGVNTDYFDQNEVATPLVQYDLVFVGNMGYFPNIEAVKFIATKVIPDLKTKGLDVTFLIAGARPGHEVNKLQNSNVKVMGWMEDIRIAYLSGRVFVAPLLHGSGQQNKMLEAMAMRMPCVTTSHVNKSLGGMHFQNLLVADTVEEISICILKLLNDKQFADQIGSEARSYIVKNFDWNINNQKLLRLFERVKNKKKK
jgi:polysaccharide biosynthesis protein PslH